MAIMKKLRVSVQLLVICPFAATYFNNSFNYSRSSFSLGLTSLLNELSFPPFSMMFISSLTSLENYNNLLLYLSLMLNIIKLDLRNLTFFLIEQLILLK
jgi:hypothetical protein